MIKLIKKCCYFLKIVSFVNTSKCFVYRKQHDLPFCHLNVKKFSTSEEPVSEVPSYYDRYIFPQPPDLVSSEEHNSK